MDIKARIESRCQLFLVIFLIPFTISVLSACSYPGQEVPFTILTEGPVLRQTSLNDISPKFFILSNARDVKALMHLQEFATPPNVLNSAVDSMFDALLNIDYKQDVGLLVLYGMDGSRGYDFLIEDIRSEEGEITVYASSLTNAQWYDFLFGGRVESMMMNDPYKVISLPHSPLLSPNNPLTFNLVLDGTFINKQEITMP